MTVVYMTDGARGVPDEYPKNIRRHEAKIALKIIGNIKFDFLELKFYRVCKKVVFEEDIQEIKELIEKANP